MYDLAIVLLVYTRMSFPLTRGLKALSTRKMVLSSRKLLEWFYSWEDHLS